MLIPTQMGVMEYGKDIQFINHFRLILVHFFDFSSFFKQRRGITAAQITKEMNSYAFKICVYCICPKRHTHNKPNRPALPQVHFPNIIFPT